VRSPSKRDKRQTEKQRAPSSVATATNVAANVAIKRFKPFKRIKNPLRVFFTKGIIARFFNFIRRLRKIFAAFLNASATKYGEVFQAKI
jgi:hypothetical protein